MRIIKTKNVKLFEEFVNESEETKFYYGIADCNGLESFLEAPGSLGTDDELIALGLTDEPSLDTIEYNRTVTMMALRCKFNNQRHAVVYSAELLESDAKTIEALLRLGKYEDALNYLKSEAVSIKLARGTGINAERAWNKIPNPSLDPMS